MVNEGLGRSYRDQEVVVRQGDPGDCMFAMQEGRLEVVRESPEGEVVVGTLKEGDLFGEMAIFEKALRSATVRALGHARVLTIDKATFLVRVQQDPSIAFNLVKSLCGRIRRLNAVLESLHGRKPEQA